MGVRSRLIDQSLSMSVARLPSCESHSYCTIMYVALLLAGPAEKLSGFYIVQIRVWYNHIGHVILSVIHSLTSCLNASHHVKG